MDEGDDRRSRQESQAYQGLRDPCRRQGSVLQGGGERSRGGSAAIGERRVDHATVAARYESRKQPAAAGTLPPASRIIRFLRRRAVTPAGTEGQPHACPRILAS